MSANPPPRDPLVIVLDKIDPMRMEALKSALLEEVGQLKADASLSARQSRAVNEMSQHLLALENVIEDSRAERARIHDKAARAKQLAASKAADEQKASADRLHAELLAAVRAESQRQNLLIQAKEMGLFETLTEQVAAEQAAKGKTR